MKVLVDKGVILCGCVLLALLAGEVDAVAVIWLLLAVATSGLSMATDRWRWVVAVPAGYLLLGTLATASVAGAPLAVHDLARIAALGTRRQRVVAAIGCAPFLVFVAGRVPGTPVLALVPVICALAALLALRTTEEETTRARLHAMRDDLREKVLALQDVNARLLRAQDHELRAAALSERTRIAREIHDGVGHVLTRLLLRVKALQVTHRDEPGVVADLATLDSDLDEALDSMRRSVHALSEEGEELATSLNLLGSRCGIAKVEVDCSTQTEPPPAVARCVVAVVREALTNAARHGRAASARVAVTDYPAFWQVTVDNDGIVPPEDEPLLDGDKNAGLGLRSMTERVEALGGRVRITPRPRFTVFATIPRDAAGREGKS
ncbi:two-component sensor histidine kinase [Arachnia propionica]|uniref:sensor histidine kinase n=1 Tax=Arachnia propionica TaxID=1750 RepID=UPI000DA2256C|nr:histidine kinase [Arachnia propionica]QCT39433.1 two-component sensor histidine kinase [Arachnia propionica]QUC13509.1 two-component sensor histidine kinase [Arachnia propionica]RPA19456.1 two-component sensor histidine kinase [Arachnia propionica]